MKNSVHSLVLCCASGICATLLNSAQCLAQNTPPKTVPKTLKPPTSTEDKVKAEFAAWRYAGAQIGASFQRGPLSLLSITTTDDMEKVWRYYMTLIPNENKVPLTYSWEIPGDNTMIGANYKIGSSFAVSLNSGPREGGTIVYQKGNENVVIEIRSRTGEQAKITGIKTDIKLIKMRPLETPRPATAMGNPVQNAENPATTW